MTIQTLYPDIQPSLNLSFALTKKLDPRITFARASSARYYDGKTVAKAEENLLLYSQEFNNAAWVNNIGTIQANAGVAPDGTTTAENLIPSASSSSFKELQQNFTAVSGLTYAFSVFVKENGYNFVQLVGTSAQFGTFAVNLDLSTGAETLFAAGTSTVLSRGITSAGNGWYRINVVVTAIASGSGRLGFCVIPADNSGRGAIWTGNGTSGVLAWGAQLEQRSALTAYTATTTQPITNYIPVLLTATDNVARFDHNPTTGESLGLLVEEQRSNLLTYSSQFDDAAWTKTRSSITANTIVAPDGTLTGDKLVEDATASDTHLITRATTVSAQAYTHTIYAKLAERSWMAMQGFTGTVNATAYFDLANGVVGTVTNGTSSIQSVGNGWYRCSLIYTVTTGVSGAFAIYLATGNSSPIYTGNGYSGIYIWGAQLEVGAFPTSYIPTVASQVTRSADAASMTGTNFSSWYRADEGTVYFESQTAQGNAATIYSFFGSNTNNRITTNYLSSLRIESSTRINGVFEGNAVTASGTAPLNTFGKGASAYKVNDFGFSWNGATTLTDTSTTLPEVILLSIGGVNALSGNFLNGTIKRLTYYPARLTNAQLQAITG